MYTPTTCPAPAQEILLEENFNGVPDGSLPAGWTVFYYDAQPPAVNQGVLNVFGEHGGGVVLPGSYARCAGLRIEFDAQMLPNQYYTGHDNTLYVRVFTGHPFAADLYNYIVETPWGTGSGGDCQQPVHSDSLAVYHAGVETCLVNRVSTAALGAWVRVAFELHSNGTLRTFLDGVETMAAADSSLASGPITLQFYRPGNIDNVIVSALDPPEPAATPTFTPTQVGMPTQTPTNTPTPADPARAIPTLSGAGWLVLALALAGGGLLVLRYSSG